MLVVHLSYISEVAASTFPATNCSMQRQQQSHRDQELFGLKVPAQKINDKMHSGRSAFD